MHEQLINDIDAWMKTMSDEDIDKINKLEMKDTERIYHEFKECFGKGMCSLCGSPLCE